MEFNEVPKKVLKECKDMAKKMGSQLGWTEEDAAKYDEQLNAMFEQYNQVKKEADGGPIKGVIENGVVSFKPMEEKEEAKEETKGETKEEVEKPTPAQPLSTFVGSHNAYVDIAQRGKTKLGLSLQYQIHPILGVGFLITRFVLHGHLTTFNLKSLSTFSVRETAKFKDGDVEFEGIRLDKLGIPVLAPGPPPMLFMQIADNYVMWDLLADWVRERCVENGFEVLVDLKPVVRKLVSGELETQMDGYQLILEFPTLGGKK